MSSIALLRKTEGPQSTPGAFAATVGPMKNGRRGTRSETTDAGPKRNGEHVTRTEPIVLGQRKNGEPGGRTGAIVVGPRKNGPPGMRTGTEDARAKNGGHGGISVGGVVWPKRSGEAGTISEAIRDRKKKNAAPRAIGRKSSPPGRIRDSRVGPEVTPNETLRS